MADGITISVPQMPSFLKAILATPDAQLKAIRRTMKREAEKMKKKFTMQQLHGRPGIQGGKLARGKNVRTHVKGSSLSSVRAEISISRLLNVHEQGLTIRPKRGDALLLHRKGRGPIFARASKVVIPSRLRFRKLVATETPAFFQKVGQATSQTTRDTLSKGLLKAL